MSRLGLVFLFSLSLSAQESAIIQPLPSSTEAEEGKPLYHPIKPSVQFEDEKKRQQESGVIGGRGEVMHSYPKVEVMEHGGGHHD